MQTLEFFVQGEPKGQPRPRAFAMKFGQKYQARMYDAGTAEGWKGQIAAHLRKAYPAFEKFTGPVSVRLDFAVKRPKSHFKGKAATLRPEAPCWNTSKPDADNYAKACLDALTILGVWDDDSQVASLHVLKKFTTNGQTGVLITISTLPAP